MFSSPTPTQPKLVQFIANTLIPQLPDIPVIPPLHSLPVRPIGARALPSSWRGVHGRSGRSGDRHHPVSRGSRRHHRHPGGVGEAAPKRGERAFGRRRGPRGTRSVSVLAKRDTCFMVVGGRVAQPLRSPCYREKTYRYIRPRRGVVLSGKVRPSETPVCCAAQCSLAHWTHAAASLVVVTLVGKCPDRLCVQMWIYVEIPGDGSRHGDGLGTTPC